MKTFEKKNIVITGAASGIGRLMALMLAEEKANCALIDINAEKLEETRAAVMDHGVKVRAYKCDLSNKKDIDMVARKIEADFHRIDILINNAGIVIGKKIVDLNYEDIKKTLEINFLGGAWLTNKFLPDMIKRNDGHIVNIASAMGFTGIPKMADYVASKFAIVGFTDTLRLELKQAGALGVKTLCVCPSGIDTGMFSGYKAPLFSPLLKPEEVARKTIKAIRNEKTYLKLPFIVRMIPAMKMLPVPVEDYLSHLTGTSRCMEHFTGKM